MTNQLPPGPFRWTTTALPGDHDGNGHVYLCDRTGRKIASIWGKPDEKVSLANFVVGNAEISARAVLFERAFAHARVSLINEGLVDMVAEIQEDLIRAGFGRLCCVVCDGTGILATEPADETICPECDGLGSIRMGVIP